MIRIVVDLEKSLSGSGYGNVYIEEEAGVYRFITNIMKDGFNYKKSVRDNTIKIFKNLKYKYKELIEEDDKYVIVVKNCSKEKVIRQIKEAIKYGDYIEKKIWRVKINNRWVTLCKEIKTPII